MSDIEIARSTVLSHITEVASSLNIKESDLDLYGKYKAKINYLNILNDKKRKEGKLILVTAINPTPLGEGKTTMSIGIADGLRCIGKKSILALREPSLGPVFGIKGGATGGGKVQIAPMEEINLHFTGDIHAVTAANNLLSSVIDNHIYFGNELRFKEVYFKRCLDLNDRQLRSVNTGLSNEKNIVPRTDKFDISVASEVMAILCLSKDLKDLKERLGNITVGINEDDELIYAKDLGVEGAMTVLLKEALKPNLVQTLEHTPAIVHGGPFANIAHGCNSVIATNTALKLADYVITEAGFGADLGAEKFLDIKCRLNNLNPSAVVIVATIKALKYHGGLSKEELSSTNIEALEKGLHNLYHHVNNLKNNFNMNVIVGINKYDNDSLEEIEYLKKSLEEKEILYSLIEGYKLGGKGCTDIAEKLVNLTEKTSKLTYTYSLEDSIYDKINMICTKIYGARGIILEDKAISSIKFIEEACYSNLPICIAKTQYSLSDDPKNLVIDEEFDIHIKDVELKTGAGFIVVMTGTIMTMPGLPKVPAANSIDIDENGEIIGIF